MKKSFCFKLVRNLSTVTTMMLLSGCMIMEHKIEKDSYYSYTGKRPDKIITSRKYEAAQGIIGASSTNYSSVMDKEYIASRSAWKDFLILLKTIPAILTGKGAW